MPSVYQGSYSAVTRRGEREIFPTLRKHNISFYAYSPIAGGFLTKDVAMLVSGGEGRWDLSGGMYNTLFNKPGMLEGLKQWEEISKGSGVSKAELAYRWVAYNSALKGELGDAIVVGSRNVEQLNQTLAALRKGPLSEEIAAQIEQVWNIVEADAPLDNFNSFPQNDNVGWGPEECQEKEIANHGHPRESICDQYIENHKRNPQLFTKLAEHVVEDERSLKPYNLLRKLWPGGIWLESGE